MKAINRTIKVTPNHSARTFTIRTYFDGKLSSKYRTYKMSKEEFESSLDNTQNDWDNFMRSNDYYVVN